MQEPALTAVIVVGFLIGFPLFWMAIVFLISRLSGWVPLARDFPAKHPASGETFGWSSARLRPFTNYGGCLTVTVSSAGIHIQPWMLYRVGHEPVMIPWGAIEDMRVSPLLFSAMVRLRLRGPTGGRHTISLYGKRLVASVRKHYESG